MRRFSVLLALHLHVLCATVNGAHAVAAENWKHWASWASEVDALSQNGVCQHEHQNINCHTSEFCSLHEKEECAGNAGIFREHFREYMVGNRTAKDVLQASFGTSEQNSTFPAWTWQCFWDGLLEEFIKQNTNDGHWRSVGEASAAEVHADTLHHSKFADWPVLLKGVAPKLLRNGTFPSNARLMDILTQVMEFRNCKGEVHDMTVKEWLTKGEELAGYKTGNNKIWAQCNLPGKEACNTSVMARDIADEILDVKAFKSAVGAIGSEITLNWANGMATRHAPFHVDSSEFDSIQLACQVSGNKSWVLLPFEALGKMTTLERLQARKDKIDGVQFHPMNVRSSLSCFPNAEQALPPPLHVVVSEGDCITVPPMWWHMTQSYGRSINLNMPITVKRTNHDAKIRKLFQHWPLKGLLQHKFPRKRWASSCIRETLVV